MRERQRGSERSIDRWIEGKEAEREKVRLRERERESLSNIQDGENEEKMERT